MRNIIKSIWLLIIMVLTPLKFYGQEEIMLEPKVLFSKSVSQNVELTSSINTKISYTKNKKFRYNNVYKAEWHLFAIYKLSTKQKTGIGYSLVRKNPFGKNFENEHRISETYIIKRAIGKCTINNKFIIEQRLFTTKYYNRFRTNLTLTLPAILNGLKRIKKRDLSNELLCNTGNNTKPTYDYRLTLGNTISLPQKQGLKIAVQYRVEHIENKKLQKQILYIITSLNINL